MVKRPIRIIATLLVIAVVCQDTASAASWTAAREPVSIPVRERRMPEIGFRIPDPAAFVEGGYRAPAADAKTLILIQDAHSNPSAQLNAARVIASAAEGGGFRTIYTEAAAGDVTLSKFLSPGADHAAARIAAEQAARKGRLAGFELADLSAPGRLTLWGVEDEKLYEEALELYRAAAAERRQAIVFLDRARRTGETLAEELLPVGALEVWRARRAHEAGDLSTLEYFGKLRGRAGSLGIRTGAYPALTLLERLARDEERMDPERIGSEQAAALAALTDRDRTELGEPARNNAGAAAQAAYWSAVLERVPAADQGSALVRYVAHLKRCRRLDAAGVLEQLERLENEVLTASAAAAGPSGAMDLIRALKALGTLHDVVLLRSTPAAFERYSRGRDLHDPVRLAAFLNARIRELDRHYDRTLFLNDAFDRAETAARRFYEVSARRDAAMVGNLLARMEASGEERAILVAGGYHAPGLTRELERLGVSYVSVIPAAAHPTDTAFYEKILLSQKTRSADRALGGPAEATAGSTPRPATRSGSLMLRPVVAGVRSDDPAAVETLRTIGIDPRSVLTASRPVPVSAGARMTHVAIASRGKHDDEHNQDSFLQMDLGEGWTVLGVFDGVGGSQSGAEASRRARDGIQRYLSDPEVSERIRSTRPDEGFSRAAGDRIDRVLQEALDSAQNEVRQIRTSQETYSATTALLALIKKDWGADGQSAAWVLNYGDGQAALWDPARPDRLRLVGVMNATGGIGRREMRLMKWRQNFLADVEDEKLLSAIEDFEADVLSGADHVHAEHEDRELLLARYRKLKAEGIPVPFTWKQAEAWIYRRMTAAIGNRETGGIYPVRSQEVRIPSGGVLMLYTDGIGDPLTRPRMLRNIRMNFGTPPAPTFRGDWRPAAMRLADELIWMAHDPNQTVTVQEYVDGLGAAGPVEYRANPRFKRDDATAAVFYNDPKAASGARMAAWKAPDLDPSEAEKVRQAFVRTPDKRGGRQEIFFLKDGVSVAVLPRMDQRPEDLKTFFDVVRYVRHISAFLNQVRVLERINPSGLRPDLPAVLGYDHASFARAETLAHGLMDRLFTGETRNAEELRRSPSLLMLQKMMDDHRIFFVESRIDGESLSDYLKDLSDPARTEALPTQDRLLDLVRKMADIYAHLKSPETGLHHLDIKPSNFMVRSAEDGTLEVAQVDFSDSVLDRDLDDPGSLGHGIVELTRRYGIATASLRYLISGEQSLDPGSTVDEVRRHYTRRDLGAFLFTLFEIFQLEERRVRASKAASDAGSSSSEARGLGSIPVDDGWYEDSFARFSRLDLERIVRSSRLDPSIRMMLQTSIERVFLPPAPPDAADPDSSAYFQHHRDLGFGFFVQLKELVDALIERSPDGSPLFTRAVPVVPHPSPSAGGLDPDAVTRDADGVQKLTERASDISQTVDASAPPVRSVGPSDAAADVPDPAPLLRWRPAASEDPLKGFMEQIAREASGSSWTTRSHGEIGIRMVPEVSSGFRNVPAAKGRMRLLVYPSDPGLEFFQGSVSGPSGGSIHFLERPKNMLRHEEKLLSPLTAPKGTLGQIILNYAPAVEVQREGGAEVRLEHVIVVDAIQTRIGYEDIDAPFRRDLDLWRDAAIRRLEVWCAKYGMALLIAHPSTIFRNKRSMLPEPQAIRNYHRVFLDEDRHARKRLGWNPYPRTLSENEWYELSGREVFARMLSEDGSPLTERQAYIPSPRTRSVLEVSGARLTLELEREALRSAARSYTGSIVDFTPKKSEAIEGGEERIGRQAVLLGADKSLGSQFVFLPPTLPLAGGGRAFVVPERHALVIPDEEWTAKDVILTTHVYACSVTSGTMMGADGRTMRFFAHTDAFGGHVLRWLRSLVGSGKARSFDLLVLAGRRDVEEGSELLRSLSMFKDEPGIRDRQPGQELNFELRSKPTALSFTLVKSGAEGGAGVLTQWAFGGGDAESEESIRRVRSPDYSLKIDWSGATPSTVAAFGSARGPEASAGARMAAVNAEDLSPNRRFKLLPEDSLDIRFPGDGTLRLELRREDWFGRPGSPQLAFALLKKGRDHSFSIGGTARQRIESRSSPVAGDPRQILSIGDGTLRFSYRVLPDGTVRFENLMRGGPLYLSAWLDPSASGARMSVSSDPPDDATRRLSRLWMKGKESMPELIFEARRAGFDGVRVRKSRIAAIPGNPRKLLRSPVSGHADTTDLWDIENIHEDQTLLANIIQHAGGEGVFLWRDTPAGYEYLVFDWGPGVRDDQDGVMEDLSGILDLAVSFRKGKLGPNPDQTNTGGMGFALHYAAKASSLMRVASANGGSLRVADKTDPDPSQASDSRIPVKQWGIALPDDVRSHTGFMVHGLSAYFPEDFRGHITAPDASDPIGRVVVTKHRPLNRPDASRRLRTREVPGLSDLEPGDHVRVHRRVRRPIRRSIDQEAGILDLYLRENRWGGHIVLDTGDILKNEDLVEVWYEGKNILSGRSSSSEHAVSPIHKISNVIGPALRSAKEKREGVPVRVKFIRRDWNEETVEGVVAEPPSVRNLGVLRMDSGLSVPINEVVGVERVGARMAVGDHRLSKPSKSRPVPAGLRTRVSALTKDLSRSNRSIDALRSMDRIEGPLGSQDLALLLERDKVLRVLDQYSALAVEYPDHEDRLRGLKRSLTSALEKLGPAYIRRLAGRVDVDVFDHRVDRGSHYAGMEVIRNAIVRMGVRAVPELAQILSDPEGYSHPEPYRMAAAALLGISRRSRDDGSVAAGLPSGVFKRLAVSHPSLWREMLAGWSQRAIPRIGIQSVASVYASVSEKAAPGPYFENRSVKNFVLNHAAGSLSDRTSVSKKRALAAVTKYHKTLFGHMDRHVLSRDIEGVLIIADEANRENARRWESIAMRSGVDPKNIRTLMSRPEDSNRFRLEEMIARFLDESKGDVTIIYSGHGNGDHIGGDEGEISYAALAAEIGLKIDPGSAERAKVTLVLDSCRGADFARSLMILLDAERSDRPGRNAHLPVIYTTSSAGQFSHTEPSFSSALDRWIRTRKPDPAVPVILKDLFSASSRLQSIQTPDLIAPGFLGTVDLRIGARMADAGGSEVRALELYGEGWDSLNPGVRRGIIKAIRENSIIKSPSKSKRRPSSDRPRRSRRSSEEDRTLVLLDEKNKWLGHATFEESSGRSVYLSDLVVKKDQRGRDLGTRLMDELFARLMSSGRVDRISWMAAGDSAAFYQKYLTDRVPYWQGGDEFMALVSASSKTPEDFRRNHPSIHDRQRRFLESLDARSERVKEIIRGLKPSDRIAGIDESGRVRYPMKAGNQGVRESRAVRSLLAAKVGRIPSWSLVRLNGLFDEAEEDGADRVVGTLLGPMDDGLNLSGEQTGWKRIADPLGLERHVPEEWRRSDEGRDPGARMAAEQGPGHGSFLGADAARELIDHFGESTDKVLEFMFGDGVRYEEIQELTVAPHGRQSNVRGIRHVLSFSVRRDGDPAPKTFFIKFYTSIRNEDEAKREMFDEAEYHRRITRQFGPDSPVIRTMIVQEPTGIWASRNGVRHIEVQEAAPGEELRHDTVIDRALWRQAAVMLGRLHQHVFHRDLFVRSGGRRGGPNVTLKRAHVFVDATPGRERVTFIDLGMAGPADGSNRDRADAEREIFLENFEHMFGAGMVERGEYPDLASARVDFMSEYQRGLEDRAKDPSTAAAASTGWSWKGVVNTVFFALHAAYPWAAIYLYRRWTGGSLWDAVLSLSIKPTFWFMGPGFVTALISSGIVDHDEVRALEAASAIKARLIGSARSLGDTRLERGLTNSKITILPITLSSMGEILHPGKRGDHVLIPSQLSYDVPILRQLIAYLLVRRSIGADYDRKVRAWASDPSSSKMRSRPVSDFFWAFLGWGDFESLKRFRHYPVLLPYLIWHLMFAAISGITILIPMVVGVLDPANRNLLRGLVRILLHPDESVRPAERSGDAASGARMAPLNDKKINRFKKMLFAREDEILEDYGVERSDRISILNQLPLSMKIVWRTEVWRRIMLETAARRQAGTREHTALTYLAESYWVKPHSMPDGIRKTLIKAETAYLSEVLRRAHPVEAPDPAEGSGRIMLPLSEKPPKGFPTVLMGHGFGGDQWDPMLDPVARTFLEQGFAVVRVDLPGHGSSVRKRIDKSQAADWLQNWIDAVVRIGTGDNGDTEVDASNVFYIGFSVGGDIGVRYAQWLGTNGKPLYPAKAVYALHPAGSATWGKWRDGGWIALLSGGFNAQHIAAPLKQFFGAASFWVDLSIIVGRHWAISWHRGEARRAIEDLAAQGRLRIDTAANDRIVLASDNERWRQIIEPHGGWYQNPGGHYLKSETARDAALRAVTLFRSKMSGARMADTDGSGSSSDAGRHEEDYWLTPEQEREWEAAWARWGDERADRDRGEIVPAEVIRSAIEEGVRGAMRYDRAMNSGGNEENLRRVLSESEGLAERLSRLELRRGSSALVVGPGHLDLLPWVLKKCGLDVEVVEPDPSARRSQNALMDHLPLSGIKIRSKLSGAAGPKYDFIFMISIHEDGSIPLLSARRMDWRPAAEKYLGRLTRDYGQVVQLLRPEGILLISRSIDDAELAQFTEGALKRAADQHKVRLTRLNRPDVVRDLTLSIPHAGESRFGDLWQASSGARMADADDGALAPAERFILNSDGETMKEVIERVGEESAQLGEESVFARLYGPHADPLAWKLRPEWGGPEFREKLSRMTLDELGNAVREAVKRGDITGRADEEGLKGRAYLKRFLEGLSDLNGLSHHIGNARRYDRFEEMDEPLVAEGLDDERRSAERYKALLQEIARRWSTPTAEERKALEDYLSPGDGFDVDLWLRLAETDTSELDRQRSGTDVVGSEGQVERSSLPVLIQRLSFIAFFIQNSMEPVWVRTHIKGRSEGSMTRDMSSGEWVASHGQLGELETISQFIHKYGAGNRSSSTTALERLIRSIQIENSRLAPGTSYRTVGDYLRRLIRDMDGSADLIGLVPDIHPDPRVVERFEPDGAQGVPQVPYGSLGAYFISKSFAGREDRLTPFHDAADRYVRTWAELKPRLSELAQAAFADTPIPPFVPEPEADLHKLLTHEDAGTAGFERWVDLGRGPLGDEERDFLVRFAARVHRETSLRTRLAAGDGALRLPVGVTSQHGFAVIGARERKGEVELFVGRNVIYRGATAELDAIADREARNAAEALADAAARSAGEFERELIDGVARLEGSPDFNRFIQIEVSQLISKDPRTRAAELRLLVSALKWIHEQKAHVFTKFYLNPEGLDDREEGLVRTLAGAYRMRVGAPSPDEIRHHNAVPVVWRAGKSGSAEETGPDTFDGWVNVLFPEPGEGLQPYGRAAYLSKAAVLGAVPDAGSSKDLWGDFRRARPEAFDPNIFDQARVLYPENTFESPADFLPAIREPGPTRRPALLSHLIRVGARLAELQRAIQQTEIMA